MHQVRKSVMSGGRSRVEQDQQRPWTRAHVSRALPECLAEEFPVDLTCEPIRSQSLTVRLRLSIQTKHIAGWISHPLGAIQKASIREQYIVAQQLQKKKKKVPNVIR